MEIMPIQAVIFGSIPEATLMLWAGLHLVGVKPPIKKVIVVGILQGVTSYFIRQYFDFGPHIWVQTGVFIIYTYLIIRIKWMAAILSVVTSFVIVTLIEGSIVIFTHANLAYLWSREWMRILYLLPHEMVLGFIIYIGRRKDISLLNEFVWLNKFTR